MSIKVIAFDFGGVYFTYNHGKLDAALAKATGVSKKKVKIAVVKDLRLLNLGKINGTQYWHTFCKLIGKEVSHKKLKRVTEAQFRPIKGMVDLAKKLRKKYTIALVTNNHEMLFELDKKYKFLKNFDVMLCSHLLKTKKPAQRIYRLLMKKTKVKAREIVFIDDLKRNIDTANKLGMHGILFKSVTQLKRELQKVI